MVVRVGPPGKRKFTLATQVPSLYTHSYKGTSGVCKLGFEERFRISYQQFIHNGNTVFASISGPSGVVLMDKSLL